MQVLLKLILTYNIFFGCVIYEALNFPKFCIVKVFAINVPNYEHDIVIPITDSNNESKSKQTCRFDLSNSSKCSCNERRCYSIYSRSCQYSIQQFTTKRSKVEDEALISLQRYWRNPIGNFYLHSQTDADVIYRRKLLSYERNLFRTRPTRSCKFHRRGIRDKVIMPEISGLIKKSNIAAEDIESNDEDIDSTAWDNWSIWSACSVTCGQGRQVRWRHCLSADCITGLKKAQLRSCRLKDCKGILGWFGIKS